MHKPFHDALLNADSALPAGLTNWNQTDGEHRFAVYRNNVMSSLINVLAGNFPVVQQLVGEAFFRAMAREFVTHHPPITPIMLLYGQTFSDFIADFPPAASVPYLADMARLEYAIQSSRHCADSQPIKSDRLTRLVEDHYALSYTGLKLAAAIRILTSDFAVASIWHAHQGSSPADLSQINIHQPESFMLSRPALKVQLHSIDPGAAEFIRHLSQGMPLAQATETTYPFDPVAVLQLLIQQQAITDLIDHSQKKGALQ
ncbi:hypothetical protein LH51_09565 [Nitrincola sp. A-D6]|uniref:HvfC/BufC N-terminal domain-containing protein n=1 Tax=Nitrincola sp. A-D6 TaxID=1545442 RepID=UPI00051FCBE6|nr:DNA-binding domain-containing protein [Nitrincola sp. A-D6]KGK42157.1 hypothetical protein LH51_09565 [Nitrincola sp. A-D6]